MEVDGNRRAGNHAQNAGVHAGGCPRRGGQQAPAPAGAHYRARRRGIAERSEALEVPPFALKFRTEKHCFSNSQQINFRLKHPEKSDKLDNFKSLFYLM